MPIVPTPEDDYVFITLKEAMQPSKEGYYQLVKDGWWPVHAEREAIALWNPYRKGSNARTQKYGSPQFNHHRAIAESIAQNTIRWPYQMRKLPSVWVPVDISEYYTS